MLKIHVDKRKDIIEIKMNGDATELLAEISFIAGSIVAQVQDKLEVIGVKREAVEEKFIESTREAIAFESGSDNQKQVINKIMSDKRKTEAFLKALFGGDMETFKKFYREEFGEEFDGPVSSESELGSISRSIFKGFKNR